MQTKHVQALAGLADELRYRLLQLRSEQATAVTPDVTQQDERILEHRGNVEKSISVLLDRYAAEKMQQANA